MKKLLIPILALFLFVGFKAIEKRIITGQVLGSEDGLPISGADISTLPSKKSIITDKAGKFKLEIGDKDTAIYISYLGYAPQTIKIGKTHDFKISLVLEARTLDQVVVTASGLSIKRREQASQTTTINAMSLEGKVAGIQANRDKAQKQKSYAPPVGIANTESYASVKENGYQKVSKNPLSTFSIDVDVASYTNIRRFINNGTLPPKDAVRIEEMINYFSYDYDQPKSDDPVHITTEIAPAPWNSTHRLVRIGLQAKTIPTTILPASNLVFLIDVSGSMSSANKLPLLITSLKLLTDQLRDKDRVSIVVYAGQAGLVLPSTSGDNKMAIKDALNKLSAGGSTAGGQGIMLAYKIATENFITGGNNRVILATDGDFNVGASSDLDMERLIEEKRKSGVFLTVLGYGMGNYKDSKMETLADKGNGNYAYIDNLTEAKKVLINEFGGTLFTLAKDVKFQLEFNPAKVQSYRLIGYENRMLNDEDFNDDKKDAGEIGSGHTVTALYEVVPVGIKDQYSNAIDPLKYQKPQPIAVFSEEMLTIKLRYKKPDGNISKMIQRTVIDDPKKGNEPTTADFKFSAAVAEFGMLLKQSEFKQQSSFEQVISLAEAGRGTDKEGYRAEFIRLVKSTQLMAKDLLSITEGSKDK
jgi:Ca-activated chloride channel family protein